MERTHVSIFDWTSYPQKLAAWNKKIREIDDIGNICYKVNNKFHRVDGPAIISPTGSKQWMQNGRRHREDGPAVVLDTGARFWYQHGRVHRIGGPAIMRYDGTLEWYQDNQLHRLDGPAMENSDGKKWWFYKGTHVAVDNQESFEHWLKARGHIK